MNNRPIRVGITHGDTNGISYELILKTFADEQMAELCTPVLFGSSRLLAYFRKMMEIESQPFHPARDFNDIRDGQCNIINITPDEIKIELGQPTEESGKAALLSLEKAVEALKAGDIDVLVTAPINKKNIQSEEFTFPGHTEYLEAKLGEENQKALMILFNDELRVALVTTHLPIKEVASAITKEKVAETITALNDSLRRDFAIERPRIAVLSLNPHVGDNGLLGAEEQESIIPAMEEADADGILTFGPFAADGFFGSGAWRHYDGVVAMYHDQGLIPLKTIAENRGVNFTAGLPFVRTSPDHGTGYDIAGKGVADETSFREAIYKAIDLFRNRSVYERAAANPLRRQYVAHGADKTVDFSKDEL